MDQLKRFEWSLIVALLLVIAAALLVNLTCRTESGPLPTVKAVPAPTVDQKEYYPPGA